METRRARRLRAPLLVALAVLLAVEAAGGLIILFARVAFGATPGLVLHVVAGLALTLVYAVYQTAHWRRVAPWRARPDYVLGLIAALSMSVTNLTGLMLAWIWWQAVRAGGDPAYPVTLAAIHTLGTMLVLTFVAAHLAAVLQRDRGATGHEGRTP
ncbi:MAG: hypothetical protein ABIS67_03135 [Candidatus Eisenbacteria bacterium]